MNATNGNKNKIMNATRQQQQQNDKNISKLVSI